MKEILTVALLAVCLPANCQLVLNAGDTFTYAFNTLPLETIVPTSPQDVPSGMFTLFYVIAPAGASVHYDVFENTAAEAPIFSGAADSLAPLVHCEIPGAWQDLQGTIRVTMVSGSAIVDFVNFRVNSPRDASTQNIFNAIIPVPEPGTAHLLGCGAFVGCIWMAMKRRRT